MRATITLFCFIVLTFSVLQTVHAQQFQANWKPVDGRPDNLIVCGDTDEAIYRVSLAPSQPQARSIQVTVQLFEGIQFVGINASNSSPGVSLIDASDPTRPVISLPNLVPTSSGRTADFALILEAKCGILDTINNHDDLGGSNPIDIFDRLSIRYTDISSSTRTELYNIDPYAAAIAAPVFSIVEFIPGAPFRVGDQVTRIDTISNGSVRGYADTVIYQLTQGRDAYLSAIRVNGIDKAFAKTANVQGDTVVTIVLAGSDFVGNILGGGAGNGDTRFDPDESLLIEEDLTILSCGINRFATHEVLFGCDQLYCWVTPLQSDLPIGSGQPEISISRPAIFPDQNVGYCQPGELTVNITNTGRESDPTFGEAHNISLSAVFSNFGASLAANGYVITQIDIAGVPITNVQLGNRLDTIAAFLSDPDGPGGLEDLDGDGYYDDLAVLGTFPLKVYYELDCSSLSDDQLNENCANDAFTTVQIFAYFDNPCGNRLNGRDINLYSPQNVQDDFQQFTQPDAFSEGPSFQVELEFGRLVFRFDENTCSNPEMRVYVDLPQGISINPGSNSLSRGGGAGMPEIGFTQTGSVAMISFDPSSQPNLTGVYNLILDLSADCTAALGETIFSTTVAYYCADCSCEHTWICEDIIGPWIHKESPPCLVTDLYPCPQGVQGNSFEINRTTIGFSDASFTTPFPSVGVNTKAAIPADSVTIVMNGLVGDNTVTDSLGVVLHYFTPNNELDTAGLFLLGSGRLEWKDGATWRSCAIPAIVHTLQNDTTETWQRFDLSACLLDNGWSINPGDSIIFSGNFEINPNGPIVDSYEFVKDLRGGFFATELGVETQCDQFGDTFRVGKPLTAFGVPANGNFPRGCAPTSLDFRLTGVNRGYTDEFGLEYRRAAKLDSLILEFDTTMLTAFDNISVELYVANHPTQGNNFFPTRPLSDFPDGRYVLLLDTLNFSADLIGNYPYLYNLRINLTPNCSSIRSSSSGDEFYQMRALPFYKDRYYATDIGSGSRVDTIAGDWPVAMSYSEPANLSLDFLTPTYQRITTDSAFIDIEICNTSSISQAARTWLTFNDTTSLLIEGVSLIDDPLNPIDIPIETYSGGHFINLGTMAQVNGVNTSSQVCDVLRLKVRSVGCGINGVRFSTGWDCDTVVPVGWTPADAMACIDDVGQSVFEPIAPFLEADLISEPTTEVALCTPVTYEFRINNAQPGTAYDVVSRFFLPAGLTYIPGSVEVEYPEDPFADSFVPTAGDFVPSDTTVRGFGFELPDLASVLPYLDANGLRGFEPSNPSDSNRFVLRVQFETNCDFRSGSIVFFETEGTEACGDQTNQAVAESAALQIIGTAPDGTHAYSIGFNPDVRISISDSTSSLEVFAINVGTDPTDVDDVIQVTLPAGFDYEPGTSIGLLPSGFVPGEPTITLTGGITLLEWPLPIGMAVNERAEIQFDVRPGAIACGGNALAGIAAIRYLTAVCVSAAANCRIPTDITQGGAQLTNLPIGEVFDIRIVENSSTCETATTELVTLEIELTTAGFSLTGNDVEVTLFNDVNGDGISNGGDLLLDQQLLSNTAGETSVTYSFSGSLNRNILDNLLIRIDSSGQALCAPQNLTLNLPQLQNAGSQDLYNMCVADDNTLDLGDAGCAGTTDLGFQWTSSPPSFVGFLSSSTIPNPVFTAPSPYTGPDTVLFILTSNRIGVGITRDTATLVIGTGVILGQGPTEVISYGDQIVLTPDVQQGASPLTYLWSPGATLSSATDAQPIASPQFDQVYNLTVTDRFGCSSTTTHLVRVENPIVPTSTTQDTTICPEATLALEVFGGSTITWAAGIANPASGGISSTTGSPVVFSSLGGIGEYLYDVTVSDTAFPGYDSTIQVRIVVDPSAGCTSQCSFPTLISEVTTNTPCADSFGTIALTFESSIAGYQSEWTDANGNVLAQNVAILTGLPVGEYRFYAFNPTDTICSFEFFSYISGEDTPFASSAATAASCGEPNGQLVLSPANFTYTWQDGFVGNSRNDLPEGVYRVAVAADSTDLNCVRYQLFKVIESGGLVITPIVNQYPTCGGLDGDVTLDVTGGTGSYDFSWSINNATNSNLSAGPYHVRVTDRNTGCSNDVHFVLRNDVPEGALVLLDGQAENCPSANDGSIDFSVVYDSGFASPADTLFISESGDTLQNGALIYGNYCIVIIDGNGCVAGGDCMTLQGPMPIQIDLESKSACGIDNGEVRITIRNGRTPMTFAYSNGTQSDTTFAGNFAPGIYTITAIDAAGCSTFSNFEIEQCDPCGYTSSSTDTLLSQISCDAGSLSTICIGGIAERADEIVIYDNGVPYTGNLVPCDYARTRLTYLIGVLNFSVPMDASITIDGVNSTARISSIQELTQFFVDNDPAGNWVFDSGALAVIGGRRSGVYSPLRVQRQGSSLVNTIAYNERIEPFGLAVELDTGFHNIVVLDTVAFCADTIYARVHCAPIDTMVINVPVSDSVNFCLSINDLLGNVTSLTNICADSTYATYATYAIVSDTCVTVTGNAVGSQVGCWVLCDNQGICDTTIVIVNVIPPAGGLIWRDTVNIGDGDQLCLTAAAVGLLPGDITITNTCSGASGTLVDFTIDDITDCINYSGLNLGEETACLEICDSAGNCVQGTLIVTVLPAVKAIVYREIFVNQLDTFCLDTVSNIASTNIFRRADDLVESRIDSLEPCVIFRGLEIGQDTLGYEAVRADGSVYQVCIVVDVVPFDGLPVAQDDSTCTVLNTPVRLNVLANDQVFGGITSFEIIRDPLTVDGFVEVNADNTITFTPAQDVCARDVEISYEVCNPNGCSNATVKICINCEELTIFTAVSPNGDGVNDVFYVAKIEEFPNNKLQIFNRWGNLVHQEEGYLNTWGGTFNGNPLPDGAYFFILEVTTENGTDAYNGYIDVRR